MELVSRHNIISSVMAIIIAVSLVSASIVLADTSTTSVTVGDAAPAVSSVEINGSSSITLTESTTTAVTITATVSDANGCAMDSVVADFYRSGVGASSCDVAGESDVNSCYPQVTCSVVGSGNTCDGGSDTSADYECSFALQYLADPTDSGDYSAQSWEVTITADDGSNTATSTDTEEVNTLLALDVTSSISFGTISANADTGASNQTATVTNTGNVKQDTEVSGDDMCTDYPTCSGDSIAASQQKYGLTDVTYDSLSSSLATSTANLATVLPKPTATSTAVTDETYWGIAIPAAQQPGSYTGQNTFTAVTDTND